MPQREKLQCQGKPKFKESNQRMGKILVHFYFGLPYVDSHQMSLASLMLRTLGL